PTIPGWKLLVWAAIGFSVLNAAVGVWLQHPEVLYFEMPGRDVLMHGRVWTLLTYALVETNWVSGPLMILCLWIVGRMVEMELPRAQFLALCAGCALTGAAVWLPLHWAEGSLLGTGCAVLVMGLLTYWCFVVPDEPVEIRLFFLIPITVRPRVFFWVLLALEAGAFLTFELPVVLGLATPFSGMMYNSAQMGGMLAGWLCAWWQRRMALRPQWGSAPAEETAPRRWLQKAMQVGAWSSGGRSESAARAGKAAPAPSRANRREMREEVDRILDKINVEGFGALSEEERQTLDRAKEWLGK
ncbi:MAG: rhomboid family intramembrane serine protease, partial [Opitutales bacterium]